MKNLLKATMLLILFSLISFSSFAKEYNTKTVTYSLKNVQNGTNGNGWVFEDVNYITTFRYEEDRAHRSFSLMCDFKLILKIKGYRYNGKIYSQEELGGEVVKDRNFTQNIIFSTGRKVLGDFYKPDKKYTVFLDTYNLDYGETPPDLASLSIKEVSFTSLVDRLVEAIIESK